MENQQSFKEHFINASVSFLYNFFIYFLFMVPFDLWKKAVLRISLQKQLGKLNISKIISPWPFLSFLKSFFFEFLFDGFIFISWFLGILSAIYAYTETEKIETFLLVLAGAYYFPIGLSLIRDILQLFILPLKKFIDWCRKPAQHMDFTLLNRTVENAQIDSVVKNINQRENMNIDISEI